MRRPIRVLSFLPLLVVAALLGCSDSVVEPEAPAQAQADGPPNRGPSFTLTVLHNNDGESDLFASDGYGSMAQFATLVDRLRAEADRYAGPSNGRSRNARRAGSILVSSGDNFLAGAEFNASLDNGVPFFDAVGLSLIGYDALALGNHEFDFGTSVLADFVESFSFGPTQPPFLSANLDVSTDAALAPLAASGRIAPSTVVWVDEVPVGIVGATTTNLPFISSPGDVTINAVAPAVQGQINALLDDGVEIIVLISHLQGLDEDLELIPQLSGVDIVVAGGGDELLANPGDELVPGDERAGDYPLWSDDAMGQAVPVITTSGGYEYLGRLVANFDAYGRVQAVRGFSGPVVVGPDIPADPELQAEVVDPVAADVAALAANVIGTTEVGLNGIREEIRTRETNLGNLDADALVWQAQQVLGPLTNPVGLQNGGGIRNDNIIGPGDITELNTFDINAFSNFVVALPGMSPAELKQVLERAYSGEEVAGGLAVEGRFGQISGMTVEFDPSAQRQITEDDGTISTPGQRVVNVTLDGGTAIITGGSVAPGAPNVTLVTIDFLANGGDNYPLPFGLAVNSAGVSYQQALFNYIVDGLGGVVTAADYPEGGEGRIVPLP